MPVQVPTTPIEIVAPSAPLATAVVLRQGSFVSTRADPEGLRFRFRRELRAAKVFTDVLDAPPEDKTPAWDLGLSAADYGETNAYTFELKGFLIRNREPVGTYVSKQSARQDKGQLLIGPTQLGQLAERAIRDLVRQIAADAERLRPYTTGGKP